MDRPAISIIIPVYRAEAYLHECIDSILSQGFNDFELILVDDGSPDGCPAICDEYSASDDKTTVIHKENGGTADARNTGIRIASGRYIMFVDCDDHLSDGCLADIAGIISGMDADVIIGGFQCDPEPGARNYIEPPLESDMINERSCDSVLEYLCGRYFLYAPWRFIVNREFLQSRDLYFCKGMQQEDEEWVPRLLCGAGSFRLYNEPFYRYRSRLSGSVTTSRGIANHLDWIRIAARLQGYSEACESPIRKHTMLRKAESLAMNALLSYAASTDEHKAMIRGCIHENEPALRKLIRRNPRWNLLTCIFGTIPGSLIYVRLFSLKGRIRGR